AARCAGGRGRGRDALDVRPPFRGPWRPRPRLPAAATARGSKTRRVRRMRRSFAAVRQGAFAAASAVAAWAAFGPAVGLMLGWDLFVRRGARWRSRTPPDATWGWHPGGRYVRSPRCGVSEARGW